MHALQIDKADCDLIRNSGLFDADWYLKRYPDVALIGMDPVEHFVWLGWRLGRDPGPNFSTQAYLHANPDIKAAGMNALLHYLQHGIAEGRVLSRGQKRLLAKPANGKRVAVFASFSEKGIVEDYVKIYLKALSSVVGHIVFVADNDVAQSDKDWLSQHVSASIFGRHGEYDFGSYKRGIQHSFDAGYLAEASELILCNDSCYGPFSDLGSLFAKMDKRGLDFWGITQNAQFSDHIQSYFVVFKRKLFSDPRFTLFFDSVTAKEKVSEVVLSYEVPMTKHFAAMGFSWGTIVDHSSRRYLDVAKIDANMTRWPLYMIESGSPFMKVKAFKATKCNFDGIVQTMKRAEIESPDIYRAIVDHAAPQKFRRALDVSFSLIMPFRNRRSQIGDSIDSVLSQRHGNYELILVDDHSSDGTVDYLKNRYKSAIANGKLVIVQLDSWKGVSAARNAGLRIAKSDWIGYIDSDNRIDPAFLESFATLIVEEPGYETFYSFFRRTSDGRIIGHPFNRTKLLNGNFIDLGTFIHSRALFERLGGFDENLKRLVDWDLIVRYTKERAPYCLHRPLLIYTDDKNDKTRISVRVPLDDAIVAVRQKHGMKFRVTTIIPTYNHKDFIEQAVRSALAQTGNIQQEILVCDDGSTDGTREIVARLAKENPGIITDISTPKNQGISETFRRSIIRSKGEFLAVLEGDDVWTHPEKLHKQVKFLTENIDCSMVFSKILVKSSITGSEKTLERQDNITKIKLDGSDFLAEPTMNLIGNFSCCMFKADLVRNAPRRLYEGRFNEIALAFYLEQHGQIGFLNEVLGIYHQHAAGVWSGSTRREQLQSGLKTRQMVLDVAAAKYAAEIKAVIQNKFLKPLAELSVSA